MRKHVLSITRDDCVWTYTKSSGPGGQHRNKTATAVIVKHPPSGAVGRASDSKSQWRNRQKAWRRMTETPEFQRWLRWEMGKSVLSDSQIQQAVESQMRPGNIKVEVRKDGNWVVDGS